MLLLLLLSVDQADQTRCLAMDPASTRVRSSMR